MMSVIREYIKNITPLLAENESMFGLMVNRQVQCRLLPKIVGNRQQLEIDLWALLHFCLDGRCSSDSVVWRVSSPMEDAVIVTVQQAIGAGRNLSGSQPAHFIDAARATMEVFLLLREHGVYPPPTLLQNTAVPRPQ